LAHSPATPLSGAGVSRRKLDPAAAQNTKE
jgi:hypothetical protein